MGKRTYVAKARLNIVANQPRHPSPPRSGLHSRMMAHSPMPRRRLDRSLDMSKKAAGREAQLEAVGLTKQQRNAVAESKAAADLPRLSGAFRETWFKAVEALLIGHHWRPVGRGSRPSRYPTVPTRHCRPRASKKPIP